MKKEMIYFTLENMKKQLSVMIKHWRLNQKMKGSGLAGQTGSAIGQLNAPRGVDVDKFNNIYVNFRYEFRI